MELTPRVRIYCFTYNRNDLLPRAIKSLLDQNFTNWVCEVHNDMPGDHFPAKHLQQLGDPRITLINHPINFGPVKSFNTAFEGCKEEYIAILEDDNWWEPDFLSEMVDAMNKYTGIQLAWANMARHTQLADGSWQKQPNAIWPAGEPLTFFKFPQARQAITQLHSNGAMLVRNQNLSALIVPENTRFDFVEHVRERAFTHPVMLINKPLANFAETLATNRPANNTGLHQHYYLLIASLLLYANTDSILLSNIWQHVRKNKVRATHNLIFAGLCDKNCRGLLRYATLADWLYFAAFNVKHPTVFWMVKNAKDDYAELWEFLKLNTGKRFE